MQKINISEYLGRDDVDTAFKEVVILQGNQIGRSYGEISLSSFEG